MKNGEVIFTGDVTAGFVVSHFTLCRSTVVAIVIVLLPQGILTGMSKAGYSISVNERELGGNIVLDALEAVLRHAWSPTHLVRQVSQNSLCVSLLPSLSPYICDTVCMCVGVGGLK